MTGRPMGSYGSPADVVATALDIYQTQGATAAAEYADVSTRTVKRWARRARVKSGYVAPRNDYDHGTLSRYRQGCRCDECRAANTAHYRLRRESA